MPFPSAVGRTDVVAHSLHDLSLLQQKDAAAATAIATSSTSSSGGKKKPGRCKFCRSKAKYVPGQRSFDASRFFRGGSGGGGGTEDGRRQQPRRAVSEDRRSDGMTTEGMGNSCNR